MLQGSRSHRQEYWTTDIKPMIRTEPVSAFWFQRKETLYVVPDIAPRVPYMRNEINTGQQPKTIYKQLVIHTCKSSSQHLTEVLEAVPTYSIPKLVK